MRNVSEKNFTVGATEGRNPNVPRRLLATLEYKEMCLDSLYVARYLPFQYSIQQNELKARLDGA